MSQLYNIQSKMTQVKKAKDKIVNDYKLQMDTIINNLNIQESNKLLTLRQDESSVLNQLNLIQSFVNRIGSELSTPEKQVHFEQQPETTFNDVSSFIGEAQYLSDKNLPLAMDNPSIMTSLLEYDQGDMKDLNFYKHK